MVRAGAEQGGLAAPAGPSTPGWTLRAEPAQGEWSPLAPSQGPCRASLPGLGEYEDSCDISLQGAS